MGKVKFARKPVRKKRRQLLRELRDEFHKRCITVTATNKWLIRHRKWLVIFVTLLAIHVLWPREIEWWKRHRGILDLNDSLQNHPFVGVCFNKTEIIPGTGAACNGRRHGIWDSALPWNAKIGAAGQKSNKVDDGPLLSVVMPFHNNGLLTCQSLHEIAIDSQLFRTEVILVDDASTQSSSQLVEICARAFADLYNIQVRVVRNEKSVRKNVIYMLVCILYRMMWLRSLMNCFQARCGFHGKIHQANKYKVCACRWGTRSHAILGRKMRKGNCSYLLITICSCLPGH